jgi:hypothetical protein
MLVIGGLLTSGFLFLVGATVVAVLADTTPTAPDFDELALPAGIAVIDSRQVCDPQRGCDGYDVLVDYPGLSGNGALQMVVSALRADGWADNGPCASAVCLGHDDLRSHVGRWTAVEGDALPMLRNAVETRQLDPEQLVYIRFFRCGVLEACG